MALVVDLADIRAADAGRVGPKVARLGELRSRGWRVPDGYAVTAQALADWVPAKARTELERLFTVPEPRPAGAGEPGLAGLSGRALELIESQPLPARLRDAVARAHERLQDRTGHGPALRTAVRSSAVSEDGANASFAGQYDTYLGVTGTGEVLAHIKKCWASGYAVRAVSYRRRLGGRDPLRAHDLAVGVLELVDVRSAGVVFTLDPVTGDPGTLVVEANWGFGESVVSGHVSPDHWAVDRATGAIREQRTGAKRQWSVFSPADGRVTLQALPDHLASRPCLGEHEVRHICERAIDIEAAEGAPQDIEWAIANDPPFPESLFILQHRPETSWGAARESPRSVREDRFDPVQYALRNVFKVPGT